MTSATEPHTELHESEPAWLAIVREQVEKLSFGTVQITVHNGRVTQVDATVRTRLEPDSQSIAPPVRRVAKPQPTRV